MYDNLNNYRVFYTVASTGSLSRAAETLFISQPAISKSISKLEEGLGVSLFNRTSKGVTLTSEGQILYNHIQQAFDNISKGEEEVKKISNLGIGELKIGVSTSLCKYILLDYLQGFIKEYPHINVTINCHSTINTIKLLKEEKIDMGLICQTDIPKGFVYNKLRDIHDIFVVSESYLSNLNLRENEVMDESANPWLFTGSVLPLLQNDDKPIVSTKGNKLSTKEILEKSNLMVLERNNVTRRHVDNYLSANAIFPSQLLEVSNMDLLLDFASIGMGVASVVREFATEALKQGKVIELPLEKNIEQRTVGFIYPKINNNQTILKKFLSYCKI